MLAHLSLQAWFVMEPLQWPFKYVPVRQANFRILISAPLPDVILHNSCNRNSKEYQMTQYVINPSLILLLSQVPGPLLTYIHTCRWCACKDHRKGRQLGRAMFGCYALALHDMAC